MKILALALAATAAIGLTSVSVAQGPQPGSAQSSQPAVAPAPQTGKTQAAQPADSQAPKETKSEKPHDCISRNPKDKTFAREIFTEIDQRRHLVGPNLVSPTFFLPAGTDAQLVLEEPYDDKKYYFGYIQRPNDPRRNGLLGRIGASRITRDHSVVEDGLAKTGDTLLTLRVPDTFGGFWWQSVDLYIYNCDGSPINISTLTTPVSLSFYSNMVVWPVILAIYLAAAFASRAAARKPESKERGPTSEPWYRYLDPVYMTAGPFGRGSLSKLQILFFSLIVFGLLAYFVARTGVLSDLSASILALLGITGLGSMASKGTDARRNQIGSENLAWLIQKGWLPSTDWTRMNKASWNDIITSDGEFDVYRYQSCIVSLIVGVAILAAGINELDSFTIPDNLLILLGVSQAVYVGGKVVAPTSVGKLNTAITELREAETRFVDAGSTAPDPDAAADTDMRRVKRERYNDYLNKERVCRFLFESVTGKKVRDDAMQPAAAS